LETQKTIKHCWILQFLLENGKKRTFLYKVACKKFSWSGQRGGIAPCPPLNTPLVTDHYVAIGTRRAKGLALVKDGPAGSSLAQCNGTLRQAVVVAVVPPSTRGASCSSRQTDRRLILSAQLRRTNARATIHSLLFLA